MRSAGPLGVVGGSAALAILFAVACGTTRDGFLDDPTTDGGSDVDGGGGGGGGGGFGGGDDDAAVTPSDEGETRDPVDCEEAKTSKSYVGCDYWPTITPNPVWEIFDYAVVVANTGAKDADVTVTGPNGTNKQTTVPAGELRKIYLAWVSSLKGGEVNECGSPPALDSSVVAAEGAYHLVSSSPVIVYQFNALEYKGEGGEAPDGSPKDWSTCPGTVKGCASNGGQKIGCFSFSNDASLLLPSTAMTTNYRVTGFKGFSVPPFLPIGQDEPVNSTVLSITATAPDTDVTVWLAATAKVLASKSGQAVPATSGGGTMTLKLASAGDVVQLVADKGKSFDFSGSLVQASKPVQVIASVPCINIPADKAACDHIEETVLPAETLGKRYLVAPPTGPKGQPVSHWVRLYGNRDGTALTYQPSKPAKCPDTLAAGQVVDCELVTKDQAFEVTGTNEFGVTTFLLGAEAYGSPLSSETKGDPSQSQYAAVEQFRTKYVFLAPNDYPVLYADVTATEDAGIEIDGAPITAPWTQIGSGPFGVHRVDLTKSGKDGAHALTAKEPVGVQVIGFGDYTSFQYPAGLNLKLIASPPVTK